MSRHTQLTPKDYAVLQYIREFKDKHGVMPTVREIAEGLDLSSTSVVAWHLRKLQSFGKIVRKPGASRWIELSATR